MTNGKGREALRETARHLFDHALRAADPAGALRAALTGSPFPAPAAGGRAIVIAVGKAAMAMAGEAMRHLPPGTEVIIVTNYENAGDPPGSVEGAKVFASGHPVPDENGLAAGEAVAAALSRATAADRVIALISGGGSALLPAPAEGLTLADKVAVNRLLLAGGLEITAMNLIRQNLSRLKGGGMLRLAAPAPVFAWILSDVIGDDLRAIASGPTVAPLGNRADAVRILRGAGIHDDLPPAVRAHLARPESAAVPPPPARNLLIGSNRQSLEAVRAGAEGWPVRIAAEPLTGDVGEAAEAILRAAGEVPKGQAACLVWGGETTVTLRGGGKGGRNQELALRIALAGEDALAGREWVFLSGGTDGRDGPTDAAGGLVDGTSAARMRAAGVDPQALLANNDSYAALAASDDLLITGASGTNVADVQILLIKS
ncbi:glycerate kinase type-2 family protein [Pseudogemmobacter humi]|uniref:Hydroxypyruvate reductase n=1 Tax=Pseudogemmobacter humi TaxID=2483812 RepID=A0A3P5X7Z6_9RHOB|nr:DUF4147 domain-containing protein [Pseudogemmobacter humi]VDC27417.1 Putative hydroxypyruvate reductase [Pseudogemmobacter humi]